MASKYYFLNKPQGIYSAPMDIPGGSVNDEITLIESDCNVIYDIYDDLAHRFPQYVTKTKMGEVSGYDFNRYCFRNFPLENTSDFPVRPFKLCIVTSIHGYEQGCAWTAAQFFRLMLENPDDPTLGFLRRNVVFEVIPVANPWGFSHNERRNEVGVDLNRNFEEDFIPGMDPASKYYGGEAPCTEAETKLLMQFIEENMDAEALFATAVKNKVAYVAGTHFYAQGGHKNTLRLNFTMESDERIELGIQKLGELLKQEVC